MKVIGIDPAPVKGLQTFNGSKDSPYALAEMRVFLKQLSQNEPVLVCWDSPLTGPTNDVVKGGLPSVHAFYRRPIEHFFNGKKSSDWNAPTGIAVKPYAECPHWALSRSLLGLPRVSSHDKKAGLPFRLVVKDTPPESGRCVVEVHPALAIWLWCRDKHNGSWVYKGGNNKQEKMEAIKVRQRLWKIIFEKEELQELIEEQQLLALKSDDELDARVAYFLGRLWLKKNKSVILLGKAELGTFLLPNVLGMKKAFDDFVKTMK